MNEEEGKAMLAASRGCWRLTPAGVWFPAPIFASRTLCKTLIFNSLRSPGAPNSCNPGYTGVSPVSHRYLTGLTP